MTDSIPSDEFEDVNEAVGAEWESETTPYERVRQVVARTYTPVSADVVAERSQTSPKTARKHLNALAEEGFVTTDTGEHGARTYRRSPESLVVEQAADILDHVSTVELVGRIGEMRDRLDEYRDEYGVDSPEELTVERTNRTLSESPPDGNEVDAETVRAWQRTRRNLAFANAALSIAHARRFVDGDRQPTDDDVPA
jgi:predicted ArsR family transcriptional regulator